MPAWITEGAVPLMAIHSCSDKKNLKLTAAMVKGIYEGGVDGYSPSGIKVVVDQSGSMSTRTFPIWCRHFVENLPDDIAEGAADDDDDDESGSDAEGCDSDAD